MLIKMFQQISGTPLSVTTGTNVFVKTYIRDADWSVKMWVHSCYAAIGGLNYYLIQNG